MYAVFMADWLRVWPKDQMFIMRYEDYGGHEGERLTELIDFLGLGIYSVCLLDFFRLFFYFEEVPNVCLSVAVGKFG